MGSASKKSPIKLSRLSTRQRRQFVFLREDSDAVALWWIPPAALLSLDVPKFAESLCLGTVTGIIDCEFDDDISFDAETRAASASYELTVDVRLEQDVRAFFGFRIGSNITFDVPVEKMWEVDGDEPLAASYEMYSHLVEGSWGLA